MGEDKENIEQLNSRLRELEISHSSLSSTIVSMNSSINEMKQMFQKFILDSERITEISGKIDSMKRVEQENQALQNKYDEMYKRFIVTEHTCQTCTINKVNDYIKDMSDKVSKIEASIDELKNSKSKMNGFWGNIGQTILTAVIFYVLYMIAIHMQPTDNPILNAPTLKKSNIQIEYIHKEKADVC